MTCNPEHDKIRIPGAAGVYEDHSLLNLFGIHSGTLKSYAGFGLAPLHFITQRGPFQDGETVLGMRYDVRTVQIVIEETLADRTDFWDRRDWLLDYLRPNRSFSGDGVQPLIYQKWLPGGKSQHFADLVTTNGSATVTSHDGRFVHWGLKAGHTFTITTGADAGTYTIVTVVNDSTLVLDANLGATATGIQYWYTRGQGLRDLYCLLEQGPTFDESVSNPQHVMAGYVEALRFIAHDPAWYGEEQEQGWEVEGALGDLVFDGAGAWLGAAAGVGRWVFAPTFVGELTDIVYWGTMEAKPTITVTGPAQDIAIENSTIDIRLDLAYDVALGETITIDTLALTVENNAGTNLLPYLTGDLATFGIYPPPQAPNRINEMFVSFIGGMGGVSTAAITWRNRYAGI
jgi:hypothetical protein